MTWWTAASSLTPIAIHDAKNISGAQMLDRIGSNHITATGTLVLDSDHGLVSVAGNGAAMSYASAVTMSNPFTVCALIRESAATKIFTDSSSGGYLLYHNANTFWYSSNGTTPETFGDCATGANDNFVFVAFAHYYGGTNYHYFLGGAFVAGTSGSVPPYIDGIGDSSLTSSENIAAIGIWSGTPSEADLQSLETACRAAMALPLPYIEATLPALEFYAFAGDNRGTAEATLPKVTASGYSGAASAVSLPRIAASAYGGDYAAPVLPALTAASRGGENVGFTLPAVAAAARAGAHVTWELPMLSAYASAHDSSGERDGHVVLPSLTLSAATGAETRAKLPVLSVASAVTVPWVATSDVELPKLSASASGRVAETASAAQGLPSLEVAGYGGALCSVTIGSITVAASGTAGGVGTVQATLPLFVAVATATTSNTASADITLPSLSMATGVRAPISLPSLNLVAIGTATVAVTYEAYALNLKHTSDKTNDELTRYTNFPFDRIVRYKDRYYGMNATGLYLLEGTTDDGDPIPWEVETHITDFGNPKIKTVERAYFGGRLGPDATVTLSVGEQADNSYSYTTPRGQTVQNYRQVFGKGAKARYFSLGVSGEDEIELDSLELAITELARRI